MESKAVIEVVDSLIGDCEPWGESHHDAAAYANCEVLGNVVVHLMQQLTDLIKYEDRYEYSIKEIAKRAKASVWEALETVDAYDSKILDKLIAERDLGV